MFGIDFIIGVAVGFFLGAALGVWLATLLLISKQSDERMSMPVDPAVAATIAEMD